MYYLLLRKSGTLLNLNPLIASYVIATACIIVPQFLVGHLNMFLVVGAPLLIYTAITFVLRQWRFGDILFIRQMLSR
jgi:hypothetical protein